jgi:nucleoredoxin
VFVSSDRDEASFREYYGEMPWLALPHSDRARARALSTKFNVSGIPTLVSRTVRACAPAGEVLGVACE